jgi:hypothetical protein
MSAAPAVAPLTPATTVATAPGPRFGLRGVLAVAAGLAVLCVALVVSRTEVGGFDIGFGSKIGNLGLSLQLATVVAGVIAIHTSGYGRARVVFVIEGAVCLFCYGWLGAVYALGMLAWYAILGTHWLGRWPRAVIALAALSGMNACGFVGGAWHAGALVFSMIFTLRMLMYAWDRWQNDLARPPLFEYLFYMLPAPLVVMPPYMLIIPAFGNFARRFAPGLDARRLARIGKHLALAALFGGVRAGFALIGDVHGVAGLYVGLLSGVSAAATYAHGFIALLLLHGVDERLPMLRPLLATRFTTYWTRYQVHQKDAQVFLFFTPALLRLRRCNRYVAIVLATAWTMMFGNTFIHVASRYCFWTDSSKYARTAWVLGTNVIMTAALATELCIDEYRARRRAAGFPVATANGWPRRALAWALTMTFAAIAST